ncbi:MAG: aminotransferase class V-fold PLP-dependent enzyme, partial [Cyclobacteriaceae bacterium]
SVSYGMANVANNLHRPKGEILVVSEQFPSNVYPWKSLVKSGYKLKVVDPGTDSMQKGLKWNERILESINKETVLVAIGHVHWADGTLFDLLSIRKRLDEVDGMLIIDGTQSVGALPFDVSLIRPDALVCAAYKWLMGPYGIGMAYFGERFDKGNPIEQNWINRENSDNFRDLVNYQDNYLPGSLRYEVGERSNFILLPMVKAALKEIIKWQPERIQDYCDALTKSFIGDAQLLGFQMEIEAYRSKHLFGLRLPEGVSGEKALKIFHQRKLSLSLRGDAIRVSPHVYNDSKDINKLMSSLRELVN